MKYAIAISGLLLCLGVNLAWGEVSEMEHSTFYAEGDTWTVAIESSIPYQAQVRPKGNLFQYVERPYRETPTRNNPPEDDDLIVTSESGQTGYAMHAWMVSADRLELGPLWIILDDHHDRPFARCWLTNDPQMNFVCTGLAVNGTLTTRGVDVEENPPGPFDHPQ